MTVPGENKTAPEASQTADSGSFTGGETERNATEITDWNDLNEVRDDLAGDYVLTTDLDEDTAGYDEHVADSNGGWLPIGGVNYRFSGTFDGDGHTIADLRIDRRNVDDDYIGLFGSVDGTVTQTHISNCDIDGILYVGAITGSVYAGTVSECTVTGTIHSENSAAGGIAGITIPERFSGSGVEILDCSVESTGAGSSTVSGGLSCIGGIVGEIADGTAIRRCFSSAEVRGRERVGGIVGTVDRLGLVSNCVATGDVAGDASIGFADESEIIGGIVGENIGTMRNCAASGDVRGDNYVGGGVGWNSSVLGVSGTVKETFVTGSVSGETNVGGLAGDMDEDTTITDSYWNVDDGPVTGIGNGAGDVTGLHTDEMCGEAAVQNMPPLDFDETWQTVTDPDDHPELRDVCERFT